MKLNVKNTEATENKELDIRTVRVRIVGDSSLITHRYPPAETYKNTIHVDHAWPMKTVARNPVKEFTDAIYWLADEEKYPGLNRAVTEAQNAESMEDFLLACAEGARFGIPAASIKSAAINAAYAMKKSLNKMSLRGTFFIEADDAAEGLIEIKSEPPLLRTDKVKYRNGYICKRYRPEFVSWSCEFNLSYNANGWMPLEEILEMIDMGGKACGIGEWRPERGGNFGTFHVER